MSQSLYSLLIDVRWRELDAYNHVNNANYLGFIEEARVRWFRALDEHWDQAEIKPIMAAVTANYRRPITWPETVRIELFVERVGGKSLTVGHRISSAGDPALVYCDGNTVLVWTDRQGHTVVLPDAIREACGA